MFLFQPFDDVLNLSRPHVISDIVRYIKPNYTNRVKPAFDRNIYLLTKSLPPCRLENIIIQRSSWVNQFSFFFHFDEKSRKVLIDFMFKVSDFPPHWAEQGLAPTIHDDREDDSK